MRGRRSAGKDESGCGYGAEAGNTVGEYLKCGAQRARGAGSHAQWNEKLDGRLAQAMMSIQAVKAVEIGKGVAGASMYGSEVQDEITYDAKAKRFTRSSNRAGAWRVELPTAGRVVRDI